MPVRNQVGILSRWLEEEKHVEESERELADFINEPALVAQLKTLRTIARKEDARERESRIIASCGDKILFAHVGQVLQDGLRDMDLACCDVTNRRYVVVLPECDGTDGARLVERLEKLVLRGTGLRVRTGIAEVRTDGLIIADLVQKASDRCASGTSEELAPKRFDKPMARESRLSA